MPETTEINGQLYVQDGDVFRPATEEERAAADNGGGGTTTLLAEADRDNARTTAEPNTNDAGGYVLSGDGIPSRVTVRFQTGTDDDNNATFETRLGRLRVDGAGALSVEFPQRAEEGDNA